MSGGRLDYFYSQVEEHVGDMGDKELNNLVDDLAKLFHAREWYLSGDTGEGEWRKERDAFKKRWFTPHGRQERIEEYLKEFSREIREELGISREYCSTCSHFTLEPKKGRYGYCDFEPHCMMHTHDSCDKWEETGPDSQKRR